MKNLQKILKSSFIVAVVFVTLAILGLSGCKTRAFAEGNLINPTEAAQKVQSEFGKNNFPKTAPATTQTQTSTNVNPDNVPVTKIDFKEGMFKFLTAMFGVLFSSLAIFLGLKLYQKFILKYKGNKDSINYGRTLESPKDFKEAINIFLDKTDKE